MKTKHLLTTALFTMTASIAVAQSVSDQVVSQLQAQGFTHIEVKQGISQVKIEAVRGTTEVEFVYDLNSGQLLSQETGTVSAGTDTSPGVEYDNEDRDFVSSDGSSNDGIGNDGSANDGSDNDDSRNDGYDDDDDDDDDRNDDDDD